MDQFLNMERFMRSFKKYLLVVLISFAALEADDSGIYEYEIRFKNKIGPFSIDGLKTFSKKEKGFGVMFYGKNRILNAEIIQESEFDLTNSRVFPKYYIQHVKMPIKGQQNQNITFDYKNRKIASSGDINWVISFLTDDIPMDPISSGFQIRQNLKSGIEEFEINLIKLDEGTFASNSFKVIDSEILKIKDVNYPCKVLERTDEKGGKSLYYVAETLDFILIKVNDERKERKILIEAEKILSFG
tara:strand:- start:584 stop:1315 length:732 start_codon:yes stop_codon:yes gene_type:complete